MFVEELTGVQAVVELAEELVEQMSLGLVVPVAGGAAGVEVAACSGAGFGRGQCPDAADGGQAPVFDGPVHDHRFSAAGAGDGCRSGVGLQTPWVGESGAVVSDLGEHPGAGQQPQAGKLVMIVASGCCSKCARAASASCSAAVRAAVNWASRAASWRPIASSTTPG